MEITIDSSILVAALRKDEEHHAKCLALFEKIKNGEHIAIEPYSILVEVVAAIRRRTGSKDIAADIGVRGMDAIVIQVAKEQNTCLVSLDEEIIEKAKSVVNIKDVSELV